MWGHLALGGFLVEGVGDVGQRYMCRVVCRPIVWIVVHGDWSGPCTPANVMVVVITGLPKYVIYYDMIYMSVCLKMWKVDDHEDPPL